MLCQMIYASVALDSSPEAIQKILQEGRKNNVKKGITSVLCYGYGIFLQVIEGGRSQVNEAYANLLNSKYHKDVEIIYFSEIIERNFPNWPLGQVCLERLNVPAVLRYVQQLPLVLDQLSGSAARAMFLEFAATAAIVRK